MPKIILLWGVHPNESEVTEELAKRLKKDLEKRGDEVKIEKFPEEITIHGLARKAAKKRDLPLYFMAPIKKVINFELRLMKNNPDSIIVEFHTTPETSYTGEIKFGGMTYGREIRKPQFWQAREFVREDNVIRIHDPLLQLGSAAEPRTVRSLISIKSWEKMHKTVYVFEMPAKYKPMPANDKLEMLKRFAGKEYAHYFEQESSLKETIAANYLSPKIIGKIGHLIDTVAKTRAGIYRMPKRKPFKQKEEDRTKTKGWRRRK